ncbi:MAG: hypothetical protein A3G20_03580 [Acidobacteria bacterium RIFCSPLOWO2_12_FULL_59_11]|nr:MAG: hypothetical protein A3G20_03580 [Acidobacteria bacterium RIFCSPLOWO2_12_FULL_59_11]
MSRLGSRTISILLWVVGWSLAGYAQQGAPGPQMGETVKAEGVVTAIQLKPAQGFPFLEVKASDGTQYTIQLDPTQAWEEQGFNPKVGDKITVSGPLCCVVAGKQVVYSAEIVWGGKSYQTPLGPAVPSMMGYRRQWMMGGPGVPGPWGGRMGPGAGMGMHGPGHSYGFPPCHSW